MLRVTLEIVPWGDESRKRTIGEMEIANVDPDFDVYNARGIYNAKLECDRSGAVKTKLSNWPRTLTAWHLVQTLLQNIYGPVNLDRDVYVDTPK